MIYRVLATGLLAGLFAGLAVATLQKFTTTPLILEAEVYEKAAEKAASNAPSAMPSAGYEEARVVLAHAEEHEHGGAVEGAAAEWEPEDGVERTVYASIATIATSMGFAFLLLAGLLASGDAITERRAIAWAAAGFVVTGLAPGAGLSPEVPGMAAADLASRQAWWFLTASMTAISIWLFLRSETPWLRALAVVLLLAPHILGAPHLHEAEASKVPPDLAARFAAMSLAVQAALWIATGFAVGVLWPRLARSGGAEAGAKT
jgi:cobalt transporter subunit CbtA